ncbi:MAG: hypothetical protein GEV10_02670 [Streptosporangiales bacterium]|nr:hypothetical protein [Streptosporangiales bacterium]
MVWWQALILAIAPASLTAGALLLQSSLTRRNETARHWSDVRFKAYAALWRSFHHLARALHEQAEAVRDSAAGDRLTVMLRADTETVRPLKEQIAEAWLVSGDSSRKCLLDMMDLTTRVLDLHRHEVTAGEIIKLNDEFGDRFDDYVTRCRQELSLRV